MLRFKRGCNLHCWRLVKWDKQLLWQHPNNCDSKILWVDGCGCARSDVSGLLIIMNAVLWVWWLCARPTRLRPAPPNTHLATSSLYPALSALFSPTILQTDFYQNCISFIRWMLFNHKQAFSSSIYNYPQWIIIYSIDYYDH